MTTKSESYDCRIPTYAVCYIEYGDPGDLTEKEIKEIDDFMQQFNRPVLDYGDNEPHFSWSNDINNIGGDIIDVVITEIKP